MCGVEWAFEMEINPKQFKLLPLRAAEQKLISRERFQDILTTTTKSQCRKMSKLKRNCDLIPLVDR